MRSITARVLRLVSLVTLAVVLSGPPEGRAQSAPVMAPRVWIQVDGTVEKVDGDRMTFKLEDGRRMVADISRMSQQERAALVAGGRSTLYGYTDQRAGRFVALLVQSETAAATRGSTLPSGSPSMAAAGLALDTRLWRLVHGRVERIDVETLTLVTDAGFAVAVDLRGVEPANRAAVARGDGVTVVGFHSGDLGQVDARFIHRDASETAGRRAAATSAYRVR